MLSTDTILSTIWPTRILRTSIPLCCLDAAFTPGFLSGLVYAFAYCAISASTPTESRSGWLFSRRRISHLSIALWLGVRGRQSASWKLAVQTTALLSNAVPLNSCVTFCCNAAYTLVFRTVLSRPSAWLEVAPGNDNTVRLLQEFLSEGHVSGRL